MVEKHFSYLPGLDGLRALAVAAVLLYHAGISPVAGGFLGVEVFFVISGYLITCVLLADRERMGRINLKQFWFRRARRLLPALFLLLLGTLGVAVLFYPEEVTELRSDTLAALGYATNWYLIVDDQSYTEFVGRPPLLLHLWSLAIEEQFYLVWPLVLALLVGRLHRAGIVVLLVGVAAASTVLMAVLWQPGAEPTRVYYGTDTRAAGLLIGAALAFVWSPSSVARSAAGWRLAFGLDLAGLAALAALVYIHLRVDQYDAFLYRGGFALVAVLTALTIAVAVHPHPRLGRLLGLQPLRWLGTRSYAVYLWHWPVFMLTRPNVDVSMDGAELLALRLGITLTLAEISYRLIERPVRSGALGRAWRAYRDGHGRQRWLEGVRWGAPVGTAACAAAVLVVFAISAQPPAPPPYLSVRAVNIVSPVGQVDAAERRTSATPPATQDQTTATPAPGVSVPGSDGTAPAGPAAGGSNPVPAYGRPSGVTVTALGDSVMVGAAPELARAIPGAEVNAEIGRQASAALDMLRQRSAAGALGDAVVIHVGNNGTFTPGQFDGMMQVLADRRVVIFVNVKVPRAWEGSNNGVISAGVGRYGNAALVDWYGASSGKPELFYSDEIHLRPEGVRLYTALITQELAKHPPPPPPAAAPAAPPPADAPPSGDTPPPADPPPGEEPRPPATSPPNAPPAPPVAHTPTPTPLPAPQPTEPPTPEPNPAPEPTPPG